LADLVSELLDEFVVRYRRGENPNVPEYLDRAGEHRDEFARLVEVVLQAVPPPQPSDEAVALARAWVEQQDPPLLVLRRDRKIRRDEVVDSLWARLGLKPELRGKLALRYHELETGQLPPARVDRRVWEALAEVLRSRADELAAWARPISPLEAQVMFRNSEPALLTPSEAPVERRSEPDEVDRLFGLS
jgi:hypothetical protein